MDAFIAFTDFVENQPPWLRPVLWGAGLVLAMFFLRLGGLVGAVLVVLTLALAEGPRAALVPLTALFVTGLAGASGGLLYSALSPVRRIGALGRWFSWILATFAYLLVALLLVNLLDRSSELSLSNPGIQFGLGIVTVLFGTLGALQFKERESVHVHLPTGPGIIRVAELRDVRQLEQASSPEARQALALILAKMPSPAYEAHWLRVLKDIESQYGGFAPYAKRRAIQLAKAGLAAAASQDVSKLQRQGVGDGGA